MTGPSWLEDDEDIWNASNGGHPDDSIWGFNEKDEGTAPPF